MIQHHWYQNNLIQKKLYFSKWSFSEIIIFVISDTLADALAALNDENHFFESEIQKREEEVEELKDQVEGLIQSNLNEHNILTAEISTRNREIANTKEYFEHDIEQLSEKLNFFEKKQAAENSGSENLLDMINQLNKEIESLRG